MAKFTVSTDSTCDLYRDYVEANDVKFVSLTYTVIAKDGSMTDHLDAFSSEAEYEAFYDELKGGALSKTSMLNYESHLEHFTKLAEAGAEDVLHFTISSGLARTHEVAEQAAAEVKKSFPDFNVTVIDPLTTTVGQGMLVRLAVQCRDEGKTAQETAEFLNGLRLKIQHFIVADDLNYLKRGGRISAAVAAVGSVLNIKPILSFDKEGKLAQTAKVRGVKKAISYIEDCMTVAPPSAMQCVCIVHTGNKAAAEELRSFVKEKFGFEPYYQWMGPVIGSHVGPGAFAVGYISDKERNEF